MAARIHSRAAIAVYARGISVVPGKEGRDGAARQRVVVLVATRKQTAGWIAPSIEEGRAP